MKIVTISGKIYSILFILLSLQIPIQTGSWI